VGAGVSKDVPAGLPLGGELAAAILETVAQKDRFLAHHTTRLRRYAVEGRSGCRLEVLLEIGRQGIGGAVVRLLRLFGLGEPNLYHLTLAKALSAGHDVVTTNFDDLIERAFEGLHGHRPVVIVRKADLMARRPRGRHGRLFKIHGSLKDGSGRNGELTIQATLASLADGLASWKRRLLEAMLHGRPVLFCGYSGGDGFDLNAVLRLEHVGRSYIWIRYLKGPLRISAVDRIPAVRAKTLPFLSLLVPHPGSVLVEGRPLSLLNRLPYAASRGGRRAPIAGVAWRPALELELERLHLSVFTRTRFVAKVLQYNRQWGPAQQCLDLNGRQSRGLQRAIAQDDVAQFQFLRRDFKRDLYWRRSARRVARRYATPEGRNIVARTWLGSGEAYRQTAMYRRAVQCFRRAKEIYDRLDRPAKTAYALAGIAGIHRMEARFGTARRTYGAAMDQFQRGRDLHGLLYARWGLAELYKYRGDVADAEGLYADVLAQALDMGFATLAAWAQWGRAELCRLRGEFRAAAQLYESALSGFGDHDVAGRSWALEGLAQCSITSGTSPSRYLRLAAKGFTSVNARFGLAAVSLDRVLAALTAGRRAIATERVGGLWQLALGPKERAHGHLLTGIWRARTHTPGAKRSFNRALASYELRGMKHAFVAAVVVALEELPQWAAGASARRHVRKAVGLASANDYRREVTALANVSARARTSSGRLPRYALTLY